MTWSCLGEKNRISPPWCKSKIWRKQVPLNVVCAPYPSSPINAVCRKWCCYICLLQRMKWTIQKPMVRFLPRCKQVKIRYHHLQFLETHSTYLMAWVKGRTSQKSNPLSVDTLRSASHMWLILTISGWCWLKIGPYWKLLQRTWGKSSLQTYSKSERTNRKRLAENSFVNSDWGFHLYLLNIKKGILKLWPDLRIDTLILAPSPYWQTFCQTCVWFLFYSSGDFILVEKVQDTRCLSGLFLLVRWV